MKISSIATVNPRQAPTITSQGAVPHRRSAQNPSAGGTAICIAIDETRAAQYIPAAIEDGRLDREGGTCCPGQADYIPVIDTNSP